MLIYKMLFIPSVPYFHYQTSIVTDIKWLLHATQRTRCICLLFCPVFSRSSCVSTVPNLKNAETPVVSPPGDNKLLGADLCRCKNRKLRLFRQPRIWQPRLCHLEAIEPPADYLTTKPVTNEPIVSTNIGQLTESSATLYAMAPCLFFGTEIRSQHFKALLDSGASNNFIPKWIVERLGLQMRRLQTPVYTLIADGTSKAVTHFVPVNMRIGTFRFSTPPRGVQIMSVLPCEESQISPSDRAAVEDLCDESKINMHEKPKAESTPLDTTPIPEVVQQVLSKF